jgi:hypothetical protein
MRYVCVTAFLLVIIMQASLAEDVQQLPLREAGEAIYYGIDNPRTPGLIESVIDRIRRETVPSIDPELHCLTRILNYDLKTKNDLKNTKILIDIMDDKYKDHSDYRMRLLQFKMLYYGGVMPDKKMLDVVIKQAEEENIALQNRYAIASLRYLVVSGESYYVLSGNMQGEILEKARQCFKEAIAFRIVQPIFTADCKKELRDLYLRAAIGLVNMTHKPEELRKLWFWPYTLETLGRRFPAKIQYINDPRANPGRINIEGTVTDWLHDMISDLDKNDAIIPHMSAVLDYLRERNGEEKR